MNLKEIKEKAADAYVERGMVGDWSMYGNFCAGFDKAIEILSACGEFTYVELEFETHPEYIVANVINIVGEINHGKYIQIEALAAANLKISQLEEQVGDLQNRNSEFVDQDVKNQKKCQQLESENEVLKAKNTTFVRLLKTVLKFTYDVQLEKNLEIYSLHDKIKEELNAITKETVK